MRKVRSPRGLLPRPPAERTPYRRVFACLWVCGALAGLLGTGLVAAQPLAYPGDLRLRHQLQLLGDAGRTHALTSTWPAAWPGIEADLREDRSPRAARRGNPASEVRGRARRAGRPGPVPVSFRLAALDDSLLLRTFEDTPRGEGEAELRTGWTGERLAVRLQAQAVREAPDDRTYRLDGSYAGVLLGDWALTAGSVPRWWGPGWHGSLILSNSARPVPALSLTRVRSDPFDLPVLRWLGPWRIDTFIGRLEGDRTVPDANLLGFRLGFRPFPWLEVGLSRTAQWGGEGRPEDWQSFRDLALGRDNQGSAGISGEGDEPGNQLGGLDLRIASPYRGFPVAVYGQVVGEDEAGYLPAKLLGQAGVETWGPTPYVPGTFRLYAELADTAVRNEGETRYNTAYSHHIYHDGYRYRGRPLGHPADADTRLASLGAVLALADGTTIHAFLRHGDLNRDGGGAHALFPEGAEVRSGYVSAERPLGALGRLKAALSWDRVEPQGGAGAAEDWSAFLEWRWTA